MNPSNHTPGPWIGRPTGNIADQGIIYAQGNGNSIAVTYSNRDTMLVAAAPQLYKALLAIYENAAGPFDDSHSAYYTIGQDEYRAMLTALYAATEP